MNSSRSRPSASIPTGRGTPAKPAVRTSPRKVKMDCECGLDGRSTWGPTRTTWPRLATPPRSISSSPACSTTGTLPTGGTRSLQGNGSRNVDGGGRRGGWRRSTSPSEQTSPPPLGVVAGGRGAIHELPQDPDEAVRIRVVGEVPRLVEHLELAARHHR